MNWSNKKGMALSFLAVIMMVIVGFIAILFVMTQFFQTAPSVLQDQICDFNIRAAHQFLSDDYDSPAGRAGEFVSDEVAKGSLKSPLCTTKVVDIDLRDAKNEAELKELVTTNIGYMSNSCWEQFGSGEIYNTFNVATENSKAKVGVMTLLFGLTGYYWSQPSVFWRNHYFSCYKFRFLFPKEFIDTKVQTYELINPDSGSLWTYTASGKKMDTSLTVQEHYEQYKKNIGSSKAKSHLPYAGAIAWNNLGYLEFVQSTKLTWGWEPDNKKWTPFSKDIFKTIRPGSGDFLDILEDGVFYEVRYYSPVVKDELITTEDGRKFFANSPIKNNIKIIPAGAESAGIEIDGIITEGTLS